MQHNSSLHRHLLRPHTLMAVEADAAVDAEGAADADSNSPTTVLERRRRQPRPRMTHGVHHSSRDNHLQRSRMLPSHRLRTLERRSRHLHRRASRPRHREGGQVGNNWAASLP